MGQLAFSISDDLQNQLNKLSNIDEYAPKALNEAAPIVERALVSEARKHSDTGSLAKSISADKPKKSKDGSWHVVVRPRGNNKRGTRNMEVLMHLEYGYQRKLKNGGIKTMQPLNIVANSVSKSQDEVLKALQLVIDEEVKK